MPTTTAEPTAPAPSGRLSRLPSADGRRSLRRRRRDRTARIVVAFGGLAIIASILGILVFLVREVVPLLRSSRVTPQRSLALPAMPPVRAVACDEQRKLAALLGADGVVRVLGLDRGEVVLEKPLLPARDPSTRELAAPTCDAGTLVGLPGFVLATGDGAVVYSMLAFESDFASGKVTPRLSEPVVIPVDPSRRAVRACAASARDRSSAVAAARADGTLVVVERASEKNLFTGEETASTSQRELASPAPVDRLLVDGRCENLFGASADGRLFWWDLRQRDDPQPQIADAGAPITAISLLIGDQSLVVGQQDGGLSVWLRVPRDGGRPRLTRVHVFETSSAPIRLLAPSARDRTFLAQDGRGGLALCYSTSERVLWSGESPLADATAATLAPKGNGILLSSARTLAPADFECHHPEASWRTFFGKVWYEGYPQPEHVWQSSSGSDESEPKHGLTPLLFGTLKATLFSLLFAVPLALLAAMYTAQFMHWSLRRIVKPVVEIMASLPSVVLGFLAGLWFAPRLSQAFLTLPLFLLVAPVAVLATGAIGLKLPRSLRHRFPDGFAAVGFIAVLAVALALCIALQRPLEVSLFDGDFLGWLRSRLGVQYDAKNCVVLGLAMGVAVIPIIFSIAEESFSNVPRSLVSGALALGADRWYTVTRVVLPTASPGLFSAVMIGFGRAVGETMIVVMASGNTPIMDWSIFNGLRSLSANIATEIPEAPEGGTLYRTLFLAALLLFSLTFLVNTAAELIRQQLRQRYARL